MFYDRKGVGKLKKKTRNPCEMMVESQALITSGNLYSKKRSANTEEMYMKNVCVNRIADYNSYLILTQFSLCLQVIMYNHTHREKS